VPKSKQATKQTRQPNTTQGKMSSPVAELDAGLNAMLVLKPPGVSGTQIKTLTNLCVNNVQSESVLIQKIFTHFKKTPGTHKLGVLYVVDSVTRRWLDQAKQQGQTVNSSAVDGTYAAGVHRVTELIPVLMNDIVQSAPPEQKVRTLYHRFIVMHPPSPRRRVHL
jgi:protein NRD1